VIAFAFQIYFDFSGYTDIGRGSAMLLGFKVPENFDLPYLAKNISDFWRRWHITLSQWLRDYLFIPLGGSRGTRLETYRNLFITMTLGGLWHGASWTFVIWGMYQGVLLVGHREFQRLFGGRLARSRCGSGRAMQAVSTLITFLLVCFGWVFFRARTMPQAFDIIRSMLGLGGTIYASTITETRLLETVLIALGWLVFVLIVKWCALPANWGWHADNRWVLQAVYYAAMLVAVIALRPGASAAFIYFQF
jgi:alginate O-acetyltransferase complex protein AlgI